MNSDTRVAGLLVAGIVGALVAGALALSSVAGADSALDDAAVLHAADMTVVSQDVAMSAIGQAVLFAENAAAGLALEDDVVAAVAEAETAVARVDSAFVSLPDSLQTSLASEYSNWVVEAETVVDLIARGEHDSASSVMSDSLAQAADAMAAGLLGERDAHAVAMAEADGGLGRSARIAGFVVVFLLPLIAILIYRESARRQLQAAVVHLDARIEAEGVAGRDTEQVVAEFASKIQVPLASISEFSDLLLNGDSNPERASDLIGLIHSRSEELSNRVEDVLAAADSLPPIEAEALEISDQIDAAISRYGQEIGGTYGAGTVETDPIRVQQILRNLLDNAVTHGGSTVSVFGDVAGSRYVIAVEDNGFGLPDHVADEFNAGTPPLETEAGLGLAVSRLLAETMAGSLDYDRIAGRTAFVLSLPIAEVGIEAPASDDLLIAAEQ